MSPYNKNHKNLVILTVAIYNRFDRYVIRESYSLVVTSVWPQFSLRWWPGKKLCKTAEKSPIYSVIFRLQSTNGLQVWAPQFFVKVEEKAQLIRHFFSSCINLCSSSIQTIYDVDQQSRLCKSIFIAFWSKVYRRE